MRESGSEGRKKGHRFGSSIFRIDRVRCQVPKSNCRSARRPQPPPPSPAAPTSSSSTLNGSSRTCWGIPMGERMTEGKGTTLYQPNGICNDAKTISLLPQIFCMLYFDLPSGHANPVAPRRAPPLPAALRPATTRAGGRRSRTTPMEPSPAPTSTTTQSCVLTQILK